jgi:hypothetical protein
MFIMPKVNRADYIMRQAPVEPFLRPLSGAVPAAW